MGQIYSELIETLQIEVMLHQAFSVIELGWEPANDARQEFKGLLCFDCS